MRSMEMVTDTTDHHRVTKNWDEAYSCLVGHGLPVLRVTINEKDQATVIWRNEPTPADLIRANRLIRNTVPAHSW